LGAADFVCTMLTKRTRHYFEAPPPIAMGFWKRGREVEYLSATDIIVALVCSGLGFIAGIIWVIQRKPKGAKMLVVSLVMVVPQMILWYFVNMIIVAMQNPRAGGF
jgi:hypothetical protein